MKSKTVLVARKRTPASKPLEDRRSTCSAESSTTSNSSNGDGVRPPLNKKTVGFVCGGPTPPQKDEVEPRMPAHARPDMPPHAQGSSASSSTPQQLLDAALLLPLKDQKWLVDRLALALQATSKKDCRDLDLWCTAVQTVLSKQLANGGYGTVLIKQMLSQRAYWDPVVEFMEHAGFKDMPVQRRQAVYMLLADVILLQTLNVCRHRGLAPSLKIFASNAQNVAACFEDQFPGYISAGLAHMVIRPGAGPAND